MPETQSYPTIVIVIRGGCLEDVVSTVDGLSYRVIDLDNVEAGEPVSEDVTPIAQVRSSEDYVDLLLQK